MLQGKYSWFLWAELDLSWQSGGKRQQPPQLPALTWNSIMCFSLWNLLFRMEAETMRGFDSAADQMHFDIHTLSNKWHTNEQRNPSVCPQCCLPGWSGIHSKNQYFTSGTKRSSKARLRRAWPHLGQLRTQTGHRASSGFPFLPHSWAGECSEDKHGTGKCSLQCWKCLHSSAHPSHPSQLQTTDNIWANLCNLGRFRVASPAGLVGNKRSAAFGISPLCRFINILGSDCDEYQQVYRVPWKQIIGSQRNNMLLYSSRHKTRGWKPHIISSYCHSMFIIQHSRIQFLSLMDVAHNSCFLECIININSIHRDS